MKGETPHRAALVTQTAPLSDLAPRLQSRPPPDRELRGRRVCVCVRPVLFRPGGTDAMEVIEALIIRSSRVLFPATARGHAPSTSGDSGLTDHSHALRPPPHPPTQRSGLGVKNKTVALELCKLDLL